ncbi:DUF1990 family protein [Nocardia vermiculata]|uniref:DUF1990 domain-containing protein n=1 Tax=Nocardia vermiculata TaxID=257274 RepID=A0A846Y6I4_9NOCA|nr:DUF1990 domain-containing protein [Nocardia vermiculata]NKY53502.1 DUF1990 domain-containing protein [Nocardia vermiculata]
MQNSAAPGQFTYPEVGATAGEFPAGYHHFRLRRRIGTGRELFESAGDRILAYGMQRGTGIFEQADTPIAEPGTALTVRLGFGPLAITAPCRVVYVLDEPDRRGFAYGTLPGHPESGEEQFAVEYDPADRSVYGVVAAFSRPAVWYIRLAGPLVGVVQRLIGARYIHAIRPT